VIPQRVKLKGFLCYKEEQEVCFDGHATLWMLSGLNGSGKSSVFDAVTYALFGHHRGGSGSAVDLINKDCDSLLVEFDFLLEGRAYRAKRTYRRNARGGGSGTQQLFVYEPDGNNTGSWVPIEDTNLKAGFTNWIEEKIGLSYETFTSSVLLLQNKAEKLLDSSPSGRHQVLASIVGLERYKELHEKAVDERKKLEYDLDLLHNRLAGLPQVTPIETAEVEGRVTAAEEAREQARTAVERLQGLEYQSRAWADLQRRLAGARQRHTEARALLQDATAIEKAVERLRDLREVTPRLHNIALLRTQLFDADGKARKLQEQKAKLVEQLAQRENALGQARDKRATLQNLIASDEAKQRDIAARLVQSTAAMEKLREYDRQESDLDRLRQDLARLPADPATACAEARDLSERLAAVAQVLPQLTRFHARRDDLRQARRTEEAAQRELEQVQIRGKQCKADVERLKPLVEDAQRALQEASDRATEERTLLAQARESLQQVTHLDGAKVCRACGQALTPGHIEEERRRRGLEVKQAEARCEQANEALRQSRTHEQRLRTEHTQADSAYREARDQYRDEQACGRQARADVERLLAECAEVHAELPEPHRSRIGIAPVNDWPATVYPNRDEIEALRTEAAGLGAARQRVQQAEEVMQLWGRLQAGEAAALKAMHRLQSELPADREGVRKQHNDLQLQDRSLDQGLRSQRVRLREADDEVDRLGRDREQAQAQLSKHDSQLKEQEVVRQHAEQSISTQVKALPPNWRSKGEKAGTADVNALNQEREGLEAAGTEQRGHLLQQARLNLDVLLREVEGLEGEEGQYPAEARQDSEVLAGLLALARRRERSCEEEHGAARQQKALLETYVRQREEIGEECLRLEGEQAEAKLLAELLGRDRLQLYLVRQAERQVVEYANAVLDRLSGGQLYLKLSGEANGEGNAAKALDLEAYNRTTGEKPINVAFLSGSQKFRVAVSLALGIGQYASRQHRPIEAVIIDEGFGCLDSQGRQVMIQELQNLRNQMRCILLVSHQEEFADAFPDGFHFYLEGGAARIRPFQK
jgi:exonuclease SbcC